MKIDGSFAQRDRFKDMKYSYLIPPSAKSLVTRIVFNHWGTDCTMHIRDPNPGLLKVMTNTPFFFFFDIMFLLVIKRHRVQNEKPLDSGFNSSPLLDYV